MTNIFLVGLGATIGAFVRNEITASFKRFSVDFPVATFLINILGAFALGLLSANVSSGALLLFLGTGFCGGFTTFGTFSMEVSQLWFQKRFVRCFIYFVLTYIFGILGFIIGIHL
jgi:Integral membrane protein possibly involved in chromosome condensation